LDKTSAFGDARLYGWDRVDEGGELAKGIDDHVVIWGTFGIVGLGVAFGVRVGRAGHRFC